MANRVTIENINSDKLVVQEFIASEVVKIKQGENLKKGCLLKAEDDNTFSVLATPLANTDYVRVYLGEDVSSTPSDFVGTVLVRGVLNKKLFEEVNTTSYDKKEKSRLQLELFGIYLMEVR